MASEPGRAPVNDPANFAAAGITVLNVARHGWGQEDDHPCGYRD